LLPPALPAQCGRSSGPQDPPQRGATARCSCPNSQNLSLFFALDCRAESVEIADRTPFGASPFAKGEAMLPKILKELQGLAACASQSQRLEVDAEHRVILPYLRHPFHNLKLPILHVDFNEINVCISGLLLLKMTLIGLFRIKLTF
jgi:hypothetical protein